MAGAVRLPLFLLCPGQKGRSCVVTPERIDQSSLKGVAVQMKAPSCREIIPARLEASFTVECRGVLYDVTCLFIRGDGKAPFDTAAASAASQHKPLLLIANMDQIWRKADSIVGKNETMLANAGFRQRHGVFNKPVLAEAEAVAQLVGSEDRIVFHKYHLSRAGDAKLPPEGILADVRAFLIWGDDMRDTLEMNDLQVYDMRS